MPPVLLGVLLTTALGVLAAGVVAGVGLRHWPALPALKRWVTVHCFGFVVIGSLMFFTALSHTHNQWLSNVWSLWVATTVGGALLCVLPKTMRLVGLALLAVWGTSWLASRFAFGWSWDIYGHLVLCGILLAFVGSVLRFGNLKHTDASNWLVCIICMLLLLDVSGWALPKIISEPTLLRKVWTVRNVMQAGLYLWMSGSLSHG